VRGACDVSEQCDGITKLCPDDDYLISESPCRPFDYYSDCDVPEYCDGSGPECPPDAVAPKDAYVCREASDDCDAPESCDGVSTFCPADTRLPNGSECHDGLGTCSFDLCCPGVTRAGVDRGCTAGDAGQVVFVTSLPVAGNVGVAGADKLCNDLASGANLAGTFSAWLSDTAQRAGSNAINRIANARYVRVDGMPVAAGVTELMQGLVTNGISLTEWGEGRNSAVWTGTSATGVAAVHPQNGGPASCSDWTSNAPTAEGMTGLTMTNESSWTADNLQTCDRSLPLYCFPAKPPMGAIAFVTSGFLYLGDGFTGLATADALCNTAATRAKLQHTFVAWLSDSRTNARSRIVDRAYSLLDGRVVARSLADLTDGVVGAINMTETGTALAHIEGQTRVWTGTDTSGNAAGHCNDWTPSADANATIGSYSSTDAAWTTFGNATTCGGAGRVYCFQAD
jgi:hypothetical protein